MFNPNSAFPRQTTYVPWISGRQEGQAINAPNFRFGGGGGPVALPSVYGRYAANAERNVRMAGGAPGVAPGVAEFQARKGLINQFYEKGQEKYRQGHRRLMGQGFAAQNPGVESLADAGKDIIADKSTPISMVPGHLAQLNNNMSTFGQQMSSPAVRPMTATEAMPRPTSNTPSRRAKVIPGQQSLF